MPILYWLGRGKPLNPYLIGILVDRLRNELKPKELRVPPEKDWEMPGMAVINEKTVMHRWMKI